MKAFIIFTILSQALLIAVITFIAQSAYAAPSTPSADIKFKLEALKKEITSKAAMLKQEVNRKLKDKAYAGKLKVKSPTSLTLATRSGPKIVSLNQDTILPKKKFAEEDYLAALGDIDEVGVLTAKKVIALPKPSPEQKTYLWGQAISISDKLVTLKDRDLKNVAVSLPPSSNVKLNDFVILAGNKTKNDIFEVEFVYVIPQGGILKIKKIATPSASLKPSAATKSAKPR